MRRRWILLVVSVLIASLGTALVAVYVRQAEARATAGQVRTPVLVAVRPIPAGAQADSLGSAVTVRQVPTELVAADAVTDLARLKGKAAERIWPGEQIVAGMFSTTASSTGLQLPPGRLAFTVNVDEAGLVAGYVQPGSTVAVFVTGATATKTGTDAKGQPVTTEVELPTQTVLAAVPVIAVGSRTGQGGSARPVVTLALTEDQVKTLADAEQTGRISFALRG